MGSHDKKRFEETGMVFRDGKLVPAKTIERVQRVAETVGVATLKRYSTNKQVRFLADALHTGRLSPGELQDSLKENARKEMRRGITKQAKHGVTPTVDTLLKEYREDADFRKLAEEVGLDETWFMNLAKTEIRDWEGTR